MKNYPLNKHLNYTNLKQIIDKNADSRPEGIAFEFFSGGSVVYKTNIQFQTDVDSLAGFFVSKGMKEQKIALIGENSYQWLVTYFATVISGNIIVPLDKELQAENVSQLLKRCGASHIVYSKMYEDIGINLVNSKIVVDAFCMDSFQNYLQQGIEYYNSHRDSFIFSLFQDDSVCSIIFTSGTTGAPKGVMLTQKSLAIDATSACRNVFFYGPGLLTLPLHHTFAFTATVLVMMVYGLPICISRSLRTLTADIQTFKPQSIALVPLYVETMYNGIWKTAKAQGKDKLLKNMVKISQALRKVGIDLRRKLFHSVLTQFGGNLDLLISGGAPLKQSYIDGMDALGIQVLNGYGITECSPVVSVNRNKYYRSGSIGLPLDRCEVRIIDGEICVKGDIVMVGYYEDDKATEESFTDGWFKTGDLGYIDDDGFLFVTGRKKNLIILSNGKNVAPEELEEKLLDIPGVIETVVYAQDGLITAEIYAKDSAGINEKIQEMNKTIPGYKRIQRVKFRDTEFDKTTTKKIKR